jgi:DNA-binding NtrC family response regulator
VEHRHGNSKIGDRILLVHDHHYASSFTGAFLRRDGYAIVEAGDLKSALEALSSASIRLVIIDMRCDQAWGMEIFSHASKVFPDVCRVLLTEVPSRGLRYLCERVQASYVEKPVRLDQLLLILRAHLADTRARNLQG